MVSKADWSGEILDQISSIEAELPQWMPRKVSRLEVHGPSKAVTPLPLIYIDDVDGRFVHSGGQIVAMHASGSTSQLLGKSCYFSSEISVSASGLLWLDGRVITAPDLMPAYWKMNLSGKHDNSKPIVDFRKPLRAIEEPCISAIGWGQSVYGHVVIEMMPRLILALQATKTLSQPPAILLPENIPSWVVDICIRSLSIDEKRIRYFDGATERVLLQNGIFPSYPSLDHPCLAKLLDEQFAMSRHERSGIYFLSRQRTINKSRACTNEHRIEEIAKYEFGAQIILPELMPWHEQIALFQKARVIAGLYGSALHTSLFGGEGLRVGAVGALSNVLSRICNLRQHQLAYQVEGFVLGHKYAVPESNFRRMMEALCNCSIEGD
jgi:hypothetical protein